MLAMSGQSEQEGTNKGCGRRGSPDDIETLMTQIPHICMNPSSMLRTVLHAPASRLSGCSYCMPNQSKGSRTGEAEMGAATSCTVEAEAAGDGVTRKTTIC